MYLKLIALLMITLNWSAVSQMKTIKSKYLQDELAMAKVYENMTDEERYQKGLSLVKVLWRESDGNQKEMLAFCEKNFIQKGVALIDLAKKLDRNFEILNGNFNKISLDLKFSLHVDKGIIEPIDELFGAYEPSSHLSDDFFENRIAFIIALNFPFISLHDKEVKGYNEKWTYLDWSLVRLGDMFSARVPAKVSQGMAKAQSDADNYISNYYIHVGRLLSKKGEKLFPEDMKLISHWNLRDELKSNYANKIKGKDKQELIYSVMLRIIDQTIPSLVINNPDLDWQPIENKVYRQGQEVNVKSEPYERYQQILNNFYALQESDKHYPQFANYIQRKFESEMEMPLDTVEKIFIDFISSPTVKEVAKLIENRLGRKLEAYDIWYDGFKARSSINEDELNVITQSKYPTEQEFKAELPLILRKLGFEDTKAKEISDLVEVDPSRGAGHAWGAQKRGEKARLRTKIHAGGMNYKGYNIAIHEFGHNVEQTISLNAIDFHLVNGVPNTAFTEAIAFLFQSRDLDILGISQPSQQRKYLYALDNFWASYEIMGVALTDIYVWKWLYDNPNSTSEQLCRAVVEIAKTIWNKYYAPVLGVKDSHILAIYSHSIDYPLYLSAYPIGHLIEFQLEEYMTGKNFADEIERICKIGRVTPNVWMKEATGKSIGANPLINATKEALKNIK